MSVLLRVAKETIDLVDNVKSFIGGGAVADKDDVISFFSSLCCPLADEILPALKTVYVSWYL